MITVLTPLSYGQQQMLKAHELTPMHVILEYYTYIYVKPVAVTFILILLRYIRSYVNVSCAALNYAYVSMSISILISIYLELH